MRYSVAGVAAVGLVTLAGSTHAQTFLAGARVAQSLVRPLFVTAPPGDLNRLFIVEQRGSGGVASRADIRIMNLPSGTIEPTPFLSVFNLPTNAATNSEQGLLGLAFDPNYATNGYFYVNYTTAVTTNGTTIIERYRVSTTNPNIADPGSATMLLTLNQPFVNHNGGWLGFGPDGYLYAALGDGGSGGDPGNRAQNTTLLFGKMLRILPDGDDFPADPNRNYSIPSTNPFATHATNAREIWAYGLRNPWRSSFDRVTGDLWIGDVGQDAWEEINFQPAATLPPFTAVNYGWRCYEGNAPYNTTNCAPQSTMTFPVHTLPQVGTNYCSITGGYVYRGCKIPQARGLYFFADYCAARVWSFRLVGTSVTELTDRTAEVTPVGLTINTITSFGEDASGELYITSGGSGNIFKILPRCYANCDGSTVAPILNVGDFTCFLQKFAAGDCYANCDDSTLPPVLNVGDFTCFLQRFAANCP
jgi:glucose/arabinose dehydrogenase